MATYGLVPVGGVLFTGYTNTLGTGQANVSSSAGQVYINGIQQGDDRIAKMLRNGGFTGATTALFLSIVGAIAGGTATKTKKQVQHVTGSPGGSVPVETITLINRASTAADVTAFQALLARSVYPSTYVADLSGNGGGGKQTAIGGAPY